MGNCCGSSATLPPSSPPAGNPLEVVPPTAPTHPPPKPSPRHPPTPSVVQLPKGRSGQPAPDAAQHAGEAPSPRPSAAPPEHARSQAAPRRADSRGYTLSPSGDAPVMQHTLPEIVLPQHPHNSRRHPSRLSRSPSMDPASLLGARSQPSIEMTRTASTSFLPNGHLPPAPQFESLLVPRTHKRQESRPNFPPALQGLLSNDFRYAVRRCSISYYYHTSIVHRFRILVVGRVRFVKPHRPWTQLMHAPSQRESGKSSLINAIFNVDMSVCI
jgi:hypothetical protein